MIAARQLLAVLLVLATVATPLVGSAAGQQAIPTQPADLTIRQESYVGDDVSRQQQNGTPIYSAKGERILIRPQNFAAANVVDFGVDRGAGELAFDQGLDLYTFESQGEEASFGLYWIVLEERTVATGNNTSTTTVERVRYEATIQITGQASLDHVSAGQVEELEEEASNWRSFNSTLQDVRESDLLLWSLRSEPPGTEELLQGMINTYVTSRDPLRLLTGGFFAVIITLTLTAGGLLWLAIREGFAAYAARKLRKRLNIYKTTETYEGEISDRILEADRAEREQIWSNLDFQDMGWPDHEAAAYRKLGKTPREAFERIVTDVLPPSLMIRERLQAMDQVGYQARVVERGPDDEIVEAEIVEATGFDFDDEADLADPSDELVAAVWNDQAMLDFDPVGADLDVSAFEQDPSTFSVEELVGGELALQIDRFEDEKAAAKLVHDHIEWAAKSEYTDEKGTPRTPMRVLNSFLETSTWLRDVHGIPSARILADHIETAILHFDPGRRAEEYADAVRSGKDV